MTDDKKVHSTNAPIDDSEERDGDWEPMVPETTDPASDDEQMSDSDAAAKEQERQLETGEESPG